MPRPVTRSLPSFAGSLFALAIALSAAETHAHGMRSGYVELDESEAGPSTMLVRTTVEVPSFAVDIDGCATSPLPGSIMGDTGRTRAFRVECDGGLAGRTLSVSSFGAIEEVSVVARTRTGGSVATLLLPSSPSVQLPSHASAFTVAGRYVELGLRHIATGADHLLFLVLLVLQLRTWKPVLAAETAFSVSHGLAFAATALGWVHVASAPVEACIALSLFLLALGARPGEPSMNPARAAVLALVFGVVHGLGFAGGLREVGMPDENAAVALLGFGLGVETGQIVVVLGLLGVLRLVRSSRVAVWGERGAVALSGSLAAYWLIARVVAILEPEMAS